MKSDDYMRERLGSKLTTTAGAVPVFAVRAPQEGGKYGTPVPAVIWRLSDIEQIEALGPAPRPKFCVYDIECRAPEHEQAGSLMDSALRALTPQMISIQTIQDEPDDPAQKLSEYYSRLARVVILNT